MSAPPKAQPTLTLIAGPNGSGKSTIVSGLRNCGTLGILVNADAIALSLAKRKHEATPMSQTQWEAAIAAEEMRWSLLEQGVSFATETVMSDLPRWSRFIEGAKEKNYRVAMYFVTTVDPAINVKRVAERVLAGGHAVDPSKIVSRYQKTMEQSLPAVLTKVDEAVLFDNSSPETGAVAVLTLSEQILVPLLEFDQQPKWAAELLLRFRNGVKPFLTRLR